MLGCVGGRWCLGSDITGCYQSKSSGLRGYPLGHPRRTDRKPCFQMEYTAMNFHVSWWCRFQRLTAGQWGIAGSFQGGRLSLEMQTDNRKLSPWKAHYSIYESSIEKGQIPAAQGGEGPWLRQKVLGNMWVQGFSQKTIKICGILSRWPRWVLPEYWDALQETLSGE